MTPKSRPLPAPVAAAIEASRKYHMNSERFVVSPSEPLAPGMLIRSEPAAPGLRFVVSSMTEASIVLLPVVREDVARSREEERIAPQDSPFSLTPVSGAVLVLRWLPIRVPRATALHALAKLPVDPARLTPTTGEVPMGREELAERLRAWERAQQDAS